MPGVLLKEGNKLISLFETIQYSGVVPIEVTEEVALNEEFNLVKDQDTLIEQSPTFKYLILIE